MNNIKEVITRLWSHVVNYCSGILNEAKTYADKKIAIIDVTALPTENINEEAFYRVLTGTFVYNQFTQNGWTCYCVETLPEIGEPVTIDMVNITAYYNLADGDVYGYAPEALASQAGIPAGWYPLSALAPAFGISWSGVITDILDDPADNSFRLLLETIMWSHKEGKWTSHKQIGWDGEGRAAVIFNHPSNIATGNVSTAMGYATKATGDYSHAESYSSHAEGDYSHAEGYYSHAEGNRSHAEGYYSHAEGNRSHAEGYYSHAEGDSSHAEGNHSHAEGDSSHAEGDSSYADGGSSHAEGNHSHAEGYSSHAEGNHSHAEGNHSHVEGDSSHAEGYSSHAEGAGYLISKRVNGEANATTYTISDTSELIVGASVRYIEYADNVPSYHTAKILAIDAVNKTITVNRTLSENAALNNQYVNIYVAGMALGDNSHSEGNRTIATGRSQHVQGEYNIVDPEYDVNNNSKRGKYADIVGNGESHRKRSNAYTLDWDGNGWFAGEVYVGGTSMDDATKLIGLPSVSSSNNGQILIVSNGTWAIANAPQGFSGSWNDLTNKPDIYTKAETEAAINAAVNAAIGAAIGGSY